MDTRSTRSPGSVPPKLSDAAASTRSQRMPSRSSSAVVHGRVPGAQQACPELIARSACRAHSCRCEAAGCRCRRSSRESQSRGRAHCAPPRCPVAEERCLDLLQEVVGPLAGGAERAEHEAGAERVGDPHLAVAPPPEVELVVAHVGIVEQRPPAGHDGEELDEVVVEAVLRPPRRCPPPCSIGRRRSLGSCRRRRARRRWNPAGGTGGSSAGSCGGPRGRRHPLGR